jgi:hypothetical protein
MIKQIAEEILAIAQAEALKTDKPMKSSAAVCVDDAMKLYVSGDYESSIRCSLDSLGYSRSVFHPACTEAKRKLASLALWTE